MPAFLSFPWLGEISILHSEELDTHLPNGYNGIWAVMSAERKMLNERPKKQKDHSDPTKWQMFWRVQKECWRRMVTPYLMYLFMSLLLLSAQAIVPDDNNALEIVLGVVCILGGAFFNAHLMYHTGVFHYDNYLTGEVHRRNARFGIHSGGDHRPEREFRPWKGFYIGFLVGIPVIVFGVLAHFFYSVASIFFIMFAGWAIAPIAWIGGTVEGGGLVADPLWSLLFVLLPVLVSGVAYLVGAYVEKRRKAAASERDEAVKAAGKK